MMTTDEATGEPPADRPEDESVDPVLERFWAVLRRLPRYLSLAVNLARDGRVPAGAKGAVVLRGAYAVPPLASTVHDAASVRQGGLCAVTPSAAHDRRAASPPTITAATGPGATASSRARSDNGGLGVTPSAAIASSTASRSARIEGET